MNSDALKSLAIKAAIAGLSWAASRYHLSGEQVAAITADVGLAGAFAAGVFAHWGMKKVPENSRVLPPPLM